METFFYLIISHFIADFMLQGNEIALKKRLINVHMIAHGFVCALAFSIPLANFPRNALLTCAFIVFVTHIIIDAARVEIIRNYKISPSGYAFWVLLGLDQILHITVIYLTFSKLLSGF